MAMQAQDWTISALAVELGKDRRTIATRLQDIEPSVIKGNVRKYRMLDAVNAVFGLVSGDLDLTAERARLAKAQADKTELEVAEKTGQLIPAEEIEAMWCDISSSIKAKMIGLPVKVARVAVAAGSIKEIETAVTDEVHAMLTELSRGDAEPAQMGD